MRVTVGYFNPTHGFEPVAHIPSEDVGNWFEASYFELLGRAAITIGGKSVSTRTVTPMALYDHPVEVMLTRMCGDGREGL